MVFNNFLKAVYEQLVAVFRSTSTIGDKVYYFEAPTDAEFPYVVFDAITETNYNNFDKDGRRYLVRVWVYDTDDSALLINNYSDSIVNECNYGGGNFSGTGITLTCSRMTDRNTTKYDNKWIRTMTFEYLIQEA